MANFVNARALGGETAAMYGVSVYFGDYSFVIDGSAVFPGGVFVKLLRTFPPEKQFDEMAKVLYEDEQSVLKRLGLKLQ